jgi:hypothetical protein
MLKRAGRGLDPTGTKGTTPGKLANKCPACPQPGINMAEGWKNRPEAEQYASSLSF